MKINIKIKELVHLINALNDFYLPHITNIKSQKDSVKAQLSQFTKDIAEENLLRKLYLQEVESTVEYKELSESIISAISTLKETSTNKKLVNLVEEKQVLCNKAESLLKELENLTPQEWANKKISAWTAALEQAEKEVSLEHLENVIKNVSELVSHLQEIYQKECAKEQKAHSYSAELPS